jgi:hypothetical protein
MNVHKGQQRLGKHHTNKKKQPISVKAAADNEHIYWLADWLQPVESRCGAVALGLACLFPSLSFDGALVALP